MVIIGVCAVAAGAWFFFLNGKISPQNGKAELSAAVVRVNGEEIARAKLEDAEAKIAMGQGIDVASLDAASLKQLETQALDALIANALIQQAVASSGIAATGAEIDAQMTIIKSQFQDDSQFKGALLEQKLSESDLRSQVAGRLAQQMYLEQAVDIASITVSDEEVNALYNQAAVSENVPPLEDVRGQIESFIVGQKQQEIITAHVQKLRAAASIEILI
ncbi:MAG: hypothetical protein UT83_C0010G0014 [Parcubacteria group bacterium GW2011_GWA2_40_143]|nr:MAG: hypothetical protein UT83_C0010G0014 [Parcubacteria group bacterium GW2011_GWA2_40_143]